MTHLIITFGQQVLPILVRLHVVIVAEILNVFFGGKIFSKCIRSLSFFLSFFLSLYTECIKNWILSFSLLTLGVRIFGPPCT